MNSADRTVKVTLEGDPAFVEATAIRLKEFFTVTYESKNQNIPSTGRCRRYLRLLPPDLAHEAGAGGQGPGVGEKPARTQGETR